MYFHQLTKLGNNSEFLVKVSVELSSEFMIKTLFINFLVLFLNWVTFADNLTLDDVSRLNETKINRIIQVQDSSHIQEGLIYAIEHGLKVSIAGKRHSQGGHVVNKNGVVLDMTDFDKILDINPKKQTITVQTGISWAQIQEAVNPYGLAIKVMQSSNIFSVGGSISVNAHGRDPRYGPLVETINQMKIMLFNGVVKTINPNQNTDLFQAITGGYGLLGIILEVEIQLTTNQLLQKITEAVSYTEYADYLRQKVIAKPEVHLHYGRLSVAVGTSFLREGRVTSYYSTGNSADKTAKLVQEKWIRRNRYLFGVSRKRRWGKQLRWKIEKAIVDPVGKSKKLISRNNAMRPQIKFLDYYSKKDTDILQEYFVPLDQFQSFIDHLRRTVQQYKVNLLNITLRYMAQNKDTLLSYSLQETIAVVLYANIGRDQQSTDLAGEWTRNLIDNAISLGGTYYLTYQGFATKEQMRQVYPAFRQFQSIKQKYDPNEVFVNKFYQQYWK